MQGKQSELCHSTFMVNDIPVGIICMPHPLFVSRQLSIKQYMKLMNSKPQHRHTLSIPLVVHACRLRSYKSSRKWFLSITYHAAYLQSLRLLWVLEFAEELRWAQALDWFPLSSKHQVTALFYMYFCNAGIQCKLCVSAQHSVAQLCVA